MGAAARVFRSQASDMGVLAAAGERMYSLLRRSPGFSAALAPRDDVDGVTHQLRAELAAVRASAQAAEVALGDLRHALAISLWAGNAPLSASPLVSVIMPTAYPARSGNLRSAIDSVMAQSYRHWELIVVDDAPAPFAEALLADVDDPRVRVVRSEARSNGGARCVGTDVAGGEFIAYLDDDCRWFPWWLHSVVSWFEAHPSIDFVHGVRMVGPSRTPRLLAEPFDPLALHVSNPADTNCIAHRRRARLDWPDAASCTDWQAVIDADHERWEHLPVLACTYGESAPDRVWGPERLPESTARIESIQRIARERRPLRVLAHNPLYPLTSETYIGDELKALINEGITVEMSRRLPSPHLPEGAPDVTLHASLEEGIARFDPDVVMFHWCTNAIAERDVVRAAGIPHAVRSHSFDQPFLGTAHDDPDCVGVWQFGHEGFRGSRSRCLPTLILGHEPLGERERVASVVASSATLPKRAIDRLLVPAAAGLGAPVRVVLGGTHMWEHVVDSVMGSAALVPNVQVELELPYSQAQSRLRSAAVMAYVIDRDVLVGQPRSVIEGALAGCTLVLPEVPHLRDMVDGAGVYYTAGDSESLARALRRALAEPTPWAERVALAERVWQRHSVAAHSQRFADELTAAVVEWRRARRNDPASRAARWWRRGVTVR